MAAIATAAEACQASLSNVTFMPAFTAVRLEMLRCLVAAMKVSATPATWDRMDYFRRLQSAAIVVASWVPGQPGSLLQINSSGMLASWEAGQPGSAMQTISSGSVSAEFQSCTLPGIEAMALDFLLGLHTSYTLQMAMAERELNGNEAAAVSSALQLSALHLTTALLWFEGMQGTSIHKSSAIVLQGTESLLAAYQRAVEQKQTSGGLNIPCNESLMRQFRLVPVALHELNGSDPARLHAMLEVSTAALQAMSPLESRMSARRKAMLSEKLRLLSVGCLVALHTKPQPAAASVAACLTAWRPFSGKALAQLSLPAEAASEIRRLVARLETIARTQERAAAVAARKAGPDAETQAAAAARQAQADAAMQALLAEEAAEAAAAAKQAAKKAKKKQARKQALKASADSQRQARPSGQQPARVLGAKPADTLPAAGASAGQPPDCCEESSLSALSGEQVASSHSAAEQSRMAVRMSLLAVDSPTTGPALPSAGSQGQGSTCDQSRPPQRRGKRQLQSNAGQQPALSRAGGQQQIARQQLEELCFCPITRQLFKDPVISSDGFTYERAAIEAWIARKGTSPMTDAPLSLADLQPSILARQLVAAYRSET